MDISFICTNIGDKFIYTILIKQQWKFSAEFSGYIILLNKNTTGDIILASIEIINIIINTNKNLYNLHYKMYLFTQKIINFLLKKNNFLKKKK
ncbi:hypothetical protein GJU05_01570 [Enterobacteriaceae endosymbiont of Donacia fulgens]|uniref:hypothetical protein n=1 Tax=Enterobacteriaceae endosymbiont of Donacia fulgens TaxID=2675778 RepID=UPI001449319C|nr:hypothetical protein GJU05_01570 [Enterobacteriaceae endosymbiont of Donacia fulgens]